MNAISSFSQVENEFSLPPAILSLFYQAALSLKDDPRRALVCIDQARRALAGAAEANAGETAKYALTGCQRRKVAAHIEAHLHRRLRVGELAALVGRSVSHFSNAFRGSFGISPHGYILACRVTRAKTAMQNSHDTLCDIALACGLSDQAHFTRVFRSHVGVPPGVWRRQQQEISQQARRRAPPAAWDAATLRD